MLVFVDATPSPTTKQKTRGLPEELASDPATLERFRREAKAASARGAAADPRFQQLLKRFSHW